MMNTFCQNLSEFALGQIFFFFFFFFFILAQRMNWS